MRCAAGALARAVVLAGRLGEIGGHHTQLSVPTRPGVEAIGLAWRVAYGVSESRSVADRPAGSGRRSESGDARSRPGKPRGSRLRLTLEDFAELDRSFPPQIQPRPAELR